MSNQVDILAMVDNVPEMDNDKNYFANRFNPASGKYDTKVVEGMEMVGDVVYIYLASADALKYMHTLKTRFSFAKKRGTKKGGHLIDSGGDRYITLTLGVK